VVQTVTWLSDLPKKFAVRLSRYSIDPVLCCFSQSKRLQVTCPKPERFGKTEIESGWYVCVAEPFNLVKPCLVYSFG